MLNAWTKSNWWNSEGGSTLVGVAFPVLDFSRWIDGDSGESDEDEPELKEEGSERETERVFLDLVVKSCLGLILFMSFMVET